MAPRTVKLPTERQDEIVDVAHRLFWTHGYENTPVQAIIDEVGIAKGTFYHHYPSKAALLEALAERVTHQALQVMEPIVADPSLGAVEKLNLAFRRTGAWKAERRDILVDLFRAIHHPANTAMMVRLQRASIDATAPLLARVIEQGLAEGVFDTRFSQQAARVMLELGVGLGRAIGDALLGQGRPLSDLGSDIDAYDDAVERLLGAPKGSIHLVDRQLLEVWRTGNPRSGR